MAFDRGRFFLVPFLGVALLAVGCKSSVDPGPTPPPGPPVVCNAPFKVGFRVVTIATGRRMGVWYPTSADEAPLQYSNETGGTAARNGAAASCGRLPVVVFSHGFHGCGTQSVFFTEQAARRGYVVAAPDHADAVCSVDGLTPVQIAPVEALFTRPDTWNDTTHVDRRNDLAAAIDWLLGSAELGGQVDPGRIGVAGHSLGGYTAVGIVGGWDSWLDTRIRAALMFSPYVQPFLEAGRSVAVGVPVMFQGGTFDIGITPSLRGSQGAYARSSRPKYYAEFIGAGHFEWTNLTCRGSGSVSSCLQSSQNARLIDDYALGFLDAFLKGDAGPLGLLSGAGLAAYQHE
jgi:predicted dienelactone hydrolase